MKHIQVGAGLMQLLFSAVAAAAGDEAEGNGNWDFQLTPLYYWSLNIGGSVDTNTPDEPGPPDPPIDLDVFDLSFKGAYSLGLDSRYKGRWGLMFDAVGVNLSNQEDDDDNLYLDFRYRQTEVSGYFRLTSGRSAWDLFAGGRYYSLRVSLEGTPAAGNATWVDPLVGARWTWQFAENWKLNLRGDIGGFGVGSDLVWQAWASVDWFPWQNVGFVAGARGLSLDYDPNDDIDINFTAWGPILGVTFRW